VSGGGTPLAAGGSDAGNRGGTLPVGRSLSDGGICGSGAMADQMRTTLNARAGRDRNRVAKCARLSGATVSSVLTRTG